MQKRDKEREVERIRDRERERLIDKSIKYSSSFIPKNITRVLFLELEINKSF